MYSLQSTNPGPGEYMDIDISKDRQSIIKKGTAIFKTISRDTQSYLPIQSDESRKLGPGVYH